MSGLDDYTNEKELFLASLIRGPLASPRYIVSEADAPGFGGRWYYAGDWGAASHRNPYNQYYGYEGAGFEESLGWPDGYINIQYPDYITVTEFGDVPPNYEPVEGSPNTYRRQLEPGEDGGQWFCPDIRTLFHAGKCVRPYYVGEYTTRIEDFPVIGGDLPPDWIYNTNDWPQLHWPHQVHWPPENLEIQFGSRVYNPLTFSVPPDFMQIRVTLDAGSYGSYNGSPGGGITCQIGSASLGFDGKPVGCPDSILWHPKSLFNLDTSGIPYGIMLEGFESQGFPARHVITPDPAEDDSYAAWIPGLTADNSFGVTSDGITVDGMSVRPALHSASGVEGYGAISANDFFSDYAAFMGQDGLYQLAGYLVRDPGGPPVWEEEDNPYNNTLWRPEEVRSLFSNWAAGGDHPYGTFGHGIILSCAFYWLPPEQTTYTPTIEFGEMWHHLRKVRGGRMGNHEG